MGRGHVRATELESSSDAPRSLAILIVDDDHAFRCFLAGACRSAGLVAVCAESLAEAPALLAERAFASVLVDLWMPGADSYAFIESTSARWPDVAIVAMTPFASLESAQRAMAAGACEYLTKLIDPVDMLRRIGRAIDQSRSAGRSG